MTQDQVSLLNYIEFKVKFNRREKEVYHALKALGGEATSDSIMQHLGYRNPNNVRPRLTDLWKRHNPPLVEKSEQVEVDTPDGVRKMWKWRAIDYGHVY